MSRGSNRSHFRRDYRSASRGRSYRSRDRFASKGAASRSRDRFASKSAAQQLVWAQKFEAGVTEKYKETKEAHDNLMKDGDVQAKAILTTYDVVSHDVAAALKEINSQIVSFESAIVKARLAKVAHRHPRSKRKLGRKTGKGNRKGNSGAHFGKGISGGKLNGRKN